MSTPKAPGTLLEHLDTIASGQVRLFICHELTEQLASIELSQQGKPDFSERKIVTQLFNPLPTLGGIIDKTLVALAEVALALWPSWYVSGAKPQPPGAQATSRLDRLPPRERIPVFIRHRVSLGWLKTADKLCRAGKMPLSIRFPSALQVQQLALAISPQDLVIIMASEDPNPAEKRLFGLARAAEWYAKETGAQVLVLISHSAAAQEELETISYDGITVSALPEKPPPSSPDSETKLRYWPVKGAPHPFSPGEQLLAQQLTKVPELSPLFEFNQSVQTVRGNHYWVDLLWREGRLVVEVDGFRVHIHPLAFVQDRHRDYELTISGYTILRLPHEEVISDVALATEKIHDVVRFCRNRLEKP